MNDPNPFDEDDFAGVRLRHGRYLSDPRLLWQAFRRNLLLFLAKARVFQFPDRLFGQRIFGRFRNPRRHLRLLHADENLRITSFGDNDLPNVFLCFTGVKQQMGGIDAEEFVGSTQMPGFSAIFVSDLRRTWFNGFAPETLAGIIRPYTRGKRVVALGNSMGGFGAIWVSGILPVDTVIAFAPQFSVHPDVVPLEQRWQEFRKDIAVWRHRSLSGSFQPDTRYYTINGSADQLHWSQFPSLPNCQHLLIEDSGHEPAAVIKRSGALTPLIVTAIGGGNLFELLQGKGVACRLTTP